MGGLLPVHRSDIPADVVAGITPAAVSIPAALGYAKSAALLAGGMQLLAWLARLGFLANFLSLPSWSDSLRASASRWLPGNSPTCWR